MHAAYLAPRCRGGQEKVDPVARLMVRDDAEAGRMPLLLPLLCTAVILVGFRIPL